MSLRTLPKAVAFQGQSKKGQILRRSRFKEIRILLISTVPFFQVEVKLKYVDAILMSIFSIL